VKYILASIVLNLLGNGIAFATPLTGIRCLAQGAHKSQLGRSYLCAKSGNQLNWNERKNPNTSNASSSPLLPAGWPHIQPPGLVVQGIIHGNFLVIHQFTLQGIQNGNLYISGGGNASIFGTLDGTLYVGSKGLAEVYGTIIGNVVNFGGQIKVYGTVLGQLNNIKGSIFVDPNASIGRN
jgi:hypothetical protein